MWSCTGRILCSCMTQNPVHYHLWGFFMPSKWTPVKFPHPNQTFSLFPWSRNDKPSCPQENHSFSFLSLCRRWNSRCTWRVWWRKAMVARQNISWFSVGNCIYITVLTMSFLYFSSFLQLPVSDGELRAPRKCKKAGMDSQWECRVRGLEKISFHVTPELVTSLSPAGSSRRWEMSLMQVWSLKLLG